MNKRTTLEPIKTIGGVGNDGGISNQSRKFKKNTWSTETSNDFHVMKLDEFGNVVVGRVFNDHGLGTGKNTTDEKTILRGKLFAAQVHKFISVKY